jgi:1-acyl-sn-glycerol-3-phosphate acyltransferase
MVAQCGMRQYRTDLPYRFHPPKPAAWFRPIGLWLNRRILRRTFRVTRLETEGWERVRERVDAGDAVLLAPNHADHADPHVLCKAANRAGLDLSFMAARELFDGEGLKARALQRMGVFSVDRDGPDVAAIRAAIGILKKGGSPLVIFPEGEIYHHHERLDPLHEGAAAILLRVARKLAGGRRALLVPVALRYRHDPSVPESFGERISAMEDRIGWKPRPRMGTDKRMIRLGAGVLALKEIEYLGRPGEGTMAERVRGLAETLLDQVEKNHGSDPHASTTPDRVRAARYRIRRRLLSLENPPGESERVGLLEDLDRAFLALQAHSYTAGYLLEKPTLDRRAETLMRLEEDLLGHCRYPAPRTARAVAGEPVDVGALLASGEIDAKKGAAKLTGMLEERLAELIENS